MEKTKNCPYCGEEIMADARKCKHCGEWLDEDFVKEQDSKTNISESETDAKSKQNGPAVVPQSGLLKETTPSKKNKKWLLAIIPIVVLMVCAGLYFGGVFGHNHKNEKNMQTNNNTEIANVTFEEDEIKMEIKKQLQNALNTGSIYDIITPEFNDAYEEASGFQEIIGSHGRFRSDLLLFELPEALIEVQRIKLVDKRMANVYITHAFDSEKQIVDSSILVMKTGLSTGVENTKWLIDDVQYYEEYDGEIQIISDKKEMIEYTNTVSHRLDGSENKEEIKKLVVGAYKSCSIQDLMTPEFKEVEEAMMSEIRKGFQPPFSTEKFYLQLGCSDAEVLGIDFHERFDGFYVNEAEVRVKLINKYDGKSFSEIITTLVLACDRHTLEWLVDDVLSGDSSYRSSYKNEMMDFVNNPEGVLDDEGNGISLNHFIGKVAGADVHMSMMVEGSMVRGKYYYDLQWESGNKTAMAFYGNWDGDHLELNEFVNNKVA